MKRFFRTALFSTKSAPRPLREDLLWTSFGGGAYEEDDSEWLPVDPTMFTEMFPSSNVSARVRPVSIRAYAMDCSLDR